MPVLRQLYGKELVRCLLGQGRPYDYDHMTDMRLYLNSVVVREAGAVE